MTLCTHNYHCLVCTHVRTHMHMQSLLSSKMCYSLLKCSLLKCVALESVLDMYLISGQPSLPFQLRANLSLLLKFCLSVSPCDFCWAESALPAWWISVAGTELAIRSISECSIALWWGNYFWKCQFSTAGDKQKKRFRLSQQGQLGLLIKDGWICLGKQISLSPSSAKLPYQFLYLWKCLSLFQEKGWDSPFVCFFAIATILFSSKNYGLIIAKYWITCLVTSMQSDGIFL